MEILHPLIQVETLRKVYSQPDWLLVDTRFDLSDPSWGFADYHRGHIPGAVFADLDRHLSGPKTPSSGRHPLPDPEVFKAFLGQIGVDRTRRVVVYDTVSGAFAARLWWMLKNYGHRNVAVLDGGFQAWVDAGLPVSQGVETNPETIFTGEPDHTQVVTTSQAVELLQHPGRILLDARSPERYRGEIEPIDTVAGHIPGSLNRFHQLNLTHQGVLKDPATLRHEFDLLFEGKTPDQVVVYCGSGVTSCHHILSMQVAGLPGALLYAGSWSEWIRDPDRPIARD